jgi:hypothetical protein
MGLGSGINLFRIPDPGPGIKKAANPGSGSATLAFIVIFSVVIHISRSVHK